MTNRMIFRRAKTTRSRKTLVLAVACSLWGCNPDATLFNEAFLSFVSGGIVPIAPGPDAGYIMALVINNTSESIEFVVTAEQEEILVRLDGRGGITGFDQPRVLEPVSVNLVTDVTSPSLAIVFDNSPATFPAVGPGELSFEAIQAVLNQLQAKDPEILIDRDFIRLLRVLRIGLGPDLTVPAGQDDGIIVRPAGSNPDTTAGAIFPSNVNSALSYDVLVNGIVDPADFKNGDIVIFLAISNANAVGGVSLSAGVIDGEEANQGGFRIDTFQTLRSEEGPISPLPQN